MTYDGIYRLTNETIGNDPTNKNGSVSYGLDPVGNRQSASSSLSGVNSGSFTYNVDDETSTDTYDANGNTTTSGGKTFTFDSENHMTSMTGNGKFVTMVYDAFGNRVSKTVNGVTTQYLVEDDVNPTGLPQVVEETVNGAVTRSYTYGLERISEAQPIQGAWTPSFYEYDGAGSVRQLTNLAANVTVTDTYEYDAFGNTVNKTGATPNNYLYRGEQFDPDLGLYYLRARYYNPATGRFLSVDPLSDEGQRRYEYAAANPVDGMDPNGSEAYIETHLLPYYFPPVWIPNWCGLSGTNPMGGGLPCKPPPDHWTVKVDYRPILRGKYGKNCNKEHGIPGCHLPFGWYRHSYVEIDGPEGNHTWGVLGINPPKNDDQEMVEDWEGNFQDPLYGAPGIQSQVVQASDQQAKAFKQALEGHVNSSYPNCPSCGIGIYHNGPLPPIDVVSFFSAYNSNTFTWNVIANFLGVTPQPISRAPGYHSSPGYAGYP
jgi:RHS repeat-associated protein